MTFLHFFSWFSNSFFISSVLCLIKVRSLYCFFSSTEQLCQACKPLAATDMKWVNEYASLAPLLLPTFYFNFVHIKLSSTKSRDSLDYRRISAVLKGPPFLWRDLIFSLDFEPLTFNDILLFDKTFNKAWDEALEDAFEDPLNSLSDCIIFQLPYIETVWNQSWWLWMTMKKCRQKNAFLDFLFT